MGTDTSSSYSIPSALALFPLRDAVLLPRGRLPLNVFEPRYLAMVEHAFANGRIIGVIRPRHDDDSINPPLYDLGCAGRITNFAETDDGRIMMTLKGISRFRIISEELTHDGFRLAQIDYSGFALDMAPPESNDQLIRSHLIDTLRQYLSALDLSADWDSVDGAPLEEVLNGVALACPFDPDEKQALLEAPDVVARANALVTMMEIAIIEAQADGHDGPDPDRLH